MQLFWCNLENVYSCVRQNWTWLFSVDIYTNNCNCCIWDLTQEIPFRDRVRIRTRFDRIRTRKRVPFLKNCRAGPRCGRGRLASQGVAWQPQVYVKIGSSKKGSHTRLEKRVRPFLKISKFCNFLTYLRDNLLDGLRQRKFEEKKNEFSAFGSLPPMY